MLVISRSGSLVRALYHGDIDDYQDNLAYLPMSQLSVGEAVSFLGGGGAQPDPLVLTPMLYAKCAFTHQCDWLSGNKLCHRNQICHT